MTRLLLFFLVLTPNLVVAQRPNCIFFIADDVSWNDYGCYGSETARTPNIDALAAKGLLFEQAFLTASSCSPSRCSIITGRYPHNNGGASELHRPLSAHLVKFPGLLRQAGYYTALSGKDHMPQEKPPADAKGPPSAWDHKDGGRSPNNSGGHANWVKVLQDRPQGKPFFLWLAAYDAHRGWDGDKQWQEQFGPKHIAANVKVPPFLVDEASTQQDLASYQNEVTRFDYFIGQVVQELERQGELDNTLLFVLADNGRPFPRAKTRLHDSGMKTGLVAHWPAGIKKPGRNVSSLVSVIDLAPTILQLAGIEIPEAMQGVSLNPLLSDEEDSVRELAFSEHNWHDYEAFGRCIRNKDYLYVINQRPYQAWQGPADSVRSPSHQALLEREQTGSLTPAQQDVLLAPRPAVELFHTATDPQQLHNLAGNSDYAVVEQELAALLSQWQDETGDTLPEELTPDTFDRRTGERSLKGTPRGTAPGSSRHADQINLPGPR